MPKFDNNMSRLTYRSMRRAWRIYTKGKFLVSGDGAFEFAVTQNRAARQLFNCWEPFQRKAMPYELLGRIVKQGRDVTGEIVTIHRLPVTGSCVRFFKYA